MRNINKKFKKGPVRVGRKSVGHPGKITFDLTKFDYITVADAADIAGIDRYSMEGWCRKYGIGKKVNKRYWVNPKKLKKFLDQDNFEIMRKGSIDHKTITSFTCPHGYKFGFDYDEKPKCDKCNQLVWLYCGRRNDKIYMLKQALMKKDRLYTKKDLQKRIEEMESRL